MVILMLDLKGVNGEKTNVEKTVLVNEMGGRESQKRFFLWIY